MPFTKLQFKPGINRDITNYTNEGGWYDCDNIRFQKGFPEKIDGWQKKSLDSYLGTCRALHPWVTLNNITLLGVGTSSKYYIDRGGQLNDVTPVRLTTGAGDARFSASSGSSTITVTENSHGAIAGDFVTFSSAASLGGDITADVLNQEYKIVEKIDNNTYTIQAREAGTSISDITVNGALSPTPVVATASDVGDGGALTIAAYQINIGLVTSVPGTGWGAGGWGDDGWGSPSAGGITQSIRLWSHDNFGEDLLYNVRDGDIYYWDASSGLGSRGVSLSSLSGANATPTIAKQVLVSDRDRHVIAFGCDSFQNPGVQDPLLIRFSDQESLIDWEPKATNTAGDIQLGSGSEIISAVETRQQILVFTDTTLYAMQFLGPPFTFGAVGVSENITIAGPNAATAVDDVVYWMGQSEFYVYNGAVQRLPCSVRDYVFDNINKTQLNKVTSGLNTSHAEIWWFYPSSDSNEINKYVIYNYLDQVWYYGSFGRTAWLNRGLFDLPIAANEDGYLYYHEFGFDDGTSDPVSPINAYIESSPIDIGDGEQFMFLRRMLPDVSFKDSTAEIPTVDFTVKVENYPNGSYSKQNVVSINPSDELKFVRLRGRQFTFRIDSDELQTTWRLGSPRLDLLPDGRR